MTNRSRKLTLRHPQMRHYALRSRSARFNSGSWVQLVVAISLGLSSIGIAIAGIWFSIQLFINPNAIGWVNHLLPQWAQIPLVKLETAQTLTQIQSSIKQLGQIPGEPVFLDQVETLQPTSLLLPVLEQLANCQSDCEQIVELRLYQLASMSHPSTETYYQLVEQLGVEGPDEELAIAPLVYSARQQLALFQHWY